MQFKRERSFLKCLCKGHINDLIEDVGWSELQCAIVRKKYLEFKTKTRICLEEHLSGTKYTKEFTNICAKLKSYFALNKNRETKLLDIYLNI